MGLPSLNPSACIGKPVTIYGLRDPRDFTVFYVGATTRRLGIRLSSHLNDACHLKIQGCRCDAIRGIADAGHRTEIVLLEIAEPGEWPEAEQFWIAYLRSLGARLTNIGIGGAGAFGSRQTAETKERRRRAQKNISRSQMHTPEAREKAATKNRHRIEIDGVVYDGIMKAAKALGIGYSTLHYRLDVGHARRITPRKNDNTIRLRGRPTGAAHHYSKAVLVDGAEYPSILAAARAIGVHHQTIRRVWLRNGKAALK